MLVNSEENGCGDLSRFGFFDGVIVECMKSKTINGYSYTMQITTRTLEKWVLINNHPSLFNISIPLKPSEHPGNIILQDNSDSSQFNQLKGIALDGVPIYSSLDNEGNDIVNKYTTSTIDSNHRIDKCGGMFNNLPNNNYELYHYRVLPSCIVKEVPMELEYNDTQAIQYIASQDLTYSIELRKEYIISLLELLRRFENLPSKSLIGYALDGHPIYSPLKDDGEVEDSLDNCNGKYSFPKSTTNGNGATIIPQNATYAYYSTHTFPYIVGCSGPGTFSHTRTDADGIHLEHISREELTQTVSGATYTSCPGGYYSDNLSPEACIPCPAGKYSTSASALSTRPICSERCPKGYYCPLASVAPIPCPGGRYGAVEGLKVETCSGECNKGYYCPSASISARQFRCGNSSVYCPAGASRPRLVDDGYFTLPVDITYESTRSSQERCSDGTYCLPNSGKEIPCPAGRYGESLSLTTTECTALCPTGHYCPLGSSQPTKCPAGTYGATEGLETNACTDLCPLGHFCPIGSTNITKCPAGRFGSSSGLTNKYCSSHCEQNDDTAPHVSMTLRETKECAQASICALGYYCPVGSVSATEKECGDASVYCPSGSVEPLPVTNGYYSIGTYSKPHAAPPKLQMNEDVKTRHSQQQCEPGFYCHKGVKFSCLPGRYNSDIGLNDTFPGYIACPECDHGYYCDASSPSSTQYICGDASLYCPNGTHIPIKIPKGYYGIGQELTTHDSIKHCEPGYYCQDGIKRPCPAGRYSDIGSTTANCEGLCDAGYYCLENSPNKTQFICPGGRYGKAGEDDAECTGSCLKGYYCPDGSTEPWQNECMTKDEYAQLGEKYYCPHGSANRIAVTSGYFATGGNSTTRYAQEPCGENDKPPIGNVRRTGIDVCVDTVRP